MSDGDRPRYTIEQVASRGGPLRSNVVDTHTGQAVGRFFSLAGAAARCDELNGSTPRDVGQGRKPTTDA